MIRFELVDYLHLVYKCYNVPPLSCVMYVDGERRVVDTVIPSMTCKDIWRVSSNGKHKTGVFLEGGAPVRKTYFNAVANYKAWYEAAKKGETYAIQPVSGRDGYKAGRSGLTETQKLGVNLTIDRLVKGKVSAYQVAGYEADDLIWVMYKQIRTAYPDAYIDIFTGDMDMLPLVDEKTTVYMRGNRTWAEPMCGLGYCNNCKDTCALYAEDSCKIRREFKNYYQVTPDTWDEFISYRSAFKGFKIPYNSVYLFKMLRGDTSDNVPMVEKGWGAKKWNVVIDQMIADGIDFANTFRYDTPWQTMYNVLIKYFPAETVAFMGLNAEGIRPRGCIGDLINLMPYPNDTATFDIQACYTALTTGQTYTPKSDGERQKAMAVFDCIKAGINPVISLRLADPIQPDLGLFQTSLNEFKINLPTKVVAY